MLTRRVVGLSSCMRRTLTQNERTSYTQGEVTSQNLWSRYDLHVVGITWLMCGVKRRRLMELFTKKLNQLVYANVHTITGLPIKCI